MAMTLAYYEAPSLEVLECRAVSVAQIQASLHADSVHEEDAWGAYLVRLEAVLDRKLAEYRGAR